MRVANRLDEVGFSDIVQIRNKVMELRAAGKPVHAFHGGEPFFDTHYCRVMVTIECSQGDPGKSFAPNAANVHSRAKRK